MHGQAVTGAPGKVRGQGSEGCEQGLENGGSGGAGEEEVVVGLALLGGGEGSPGGDCFWEWEGVRIPEMGLMGSAEWRSWLMSAEQGRIISQNSLSRVS